MIKQNFTILILSLCIATIGNDLKVVFGLEKGIEINVFPEKSPVISGVNISTNSFSPKNNQVLEISYTLSVTAKVSIKIFDFDDCLVRTICLEKLAESGKQTHVWDGKDDDDVIVPDEAYYFTIEAEDSNRNKYVYDPITFWSMEISEVRTSRYNFSAKEYIYELPKMARVLVRLGIHKGSMLRTLVDWEPKLAGKNIEYWDGMDESGVVEFWDDEQFSSQISYKSFPENTVISWGNFDTNIKKYKLESGRECKEKKVRNWVGKGEKGIFPGYLKTKIYEKSPKVSLSFPEFKGIDVPVLRKNAFVRVNLGKLDKRIIQDQQFEIIFFVDQLFVAEEEQGYFPYNWEWNVADLAEGEHVLTVNVASFRGLVGVASRKVIVKR